MLHFSNLKIIGIGLIVFLGFLFSSPNFMDERTRLSLPRFLPGGQLNLGLDLQGGSHLLLEVDTGVVQSDRVEEIVSDVRQALRGRQIGYTGLGRLRDGVTVTIRDANDIELAREVLRPEYEAGEEPDRHLAVGRLYERQRIDEPADELLCV